MTRKRGDKKRFGQLGEFGLIDLVRKKYGRVPSGVLGIGDDAAVIPYGRGKNILVTTDMLVEGVHFPAGTPSRLIGRKAMACSMSDIAAMGGTPRWAFISLGLKPSFSGSFVQGLYEGMSRVASPWRIAIAGGDTVQCDKTIISVCLVGEGKNVITRRGAKKGDIIFITGRLGNSFKSQWHLKFVPRLKESAFLAERFRPTAMIDISDGLASDLGHILKQSRCAAELYEAKIPLRKGASLENAFHEGEDFELLFTLKPSLARKILRQNQFRFYAVGKVTSGPPSIFLIQRNGRMKNVPLKGYQHFA